MRFAGLFVTFALVAMVVAGCQITFGSGGEEATATTPATTNTPTGPYVAGGDIAGNSAQEAVQTETGPSGEVYRYDPSSGSRTVLVKGTAAIKQHAQGEQFFLDTPLHFEGVEIYGLTGCGHDAVEAPLTQVAGNESVDTVVVGDGLLKRGQWLLNAWTKKPGDGQNRWFLLLKATSAYRQGGSGQILCRGDIWTLQDLAAEGQPHSLVVLGRPGEYPGQESFAH